MADDIGKHIKLSDQWELIHMEDNTLLLGCMHGDDRFILQIGYCTLTDPSTLEEGINLIRSAGHSLARPN